LNLNPFSQRGGTRVAPGVRRLVLPVDRPRALANPQDIPLSLTLREGADRHGILAPDSGTPWGCLFFMLFGFSLILAIFSRHWAVVFSLGGLILLWGFYNHPRRLAAESMVRALGHVGRGEAVEGLRETARALEKVPGRAGVQYVAALARAGAGRWEEALESLELSERSFRRYAEFFDLRARIRKRLGRDELAMEDYRRALEFVDYPGMNRLKREFDEDSWNLPEDSA